MLNLYDKLREIPLFQGLTSDNLMQIIGQTKFSFKKFGKNEIIKKEGEKCNNIVILLNGDVKVVAHADDHSYSIEEHIKAPCILQIEHFMGLSPHYTRTFTSPTSLSSSVSICLTSCQQWRRKQSVSFGIQCLLRYGHASPRSLNYAASRLSVLK